MRLTEYACHLSMAPATPQCTTTITIINTDLVDGDSVDVGVVDKPDDLVGEELAVVLRAQIGLRRLRAVQLQGLADPLAQHVQRRVRLHDLCHRLLDQRLAAGKPVAERTATTSASHDTNDLRCFSIDSLEMGCVSSLSNLLQHSTGT